MVTTFALSNQFFGHIIGALTIENLLTQIGIWSLTETTQNQQNVHLLELSPTELRMCVHLQNY